MSRFDAVFFIDFTNLSAADPSLEGAVRFSGHEIIPHSSSCNLRASLGSSS